MPSCKYGSHVPFAPVHRHVRRLLKFMSYPEIAERAGLSVDTVNPIGGAKRSRPGMPRQHVTAFVAERLLAVEVPKERTSFCGLVRIEGPRRRSQALATMGFGVKRQAHELGISSHTVDRIANASRRDVPAQWCKPEIATAIDKLYQRITRDGLPAANAHELSARAKSIAAATSHGWHGPDAWDEDTIDDPRAEPYSHRDARKPPKDTVSPSMVWVAIAGGSELAELTLAERVEVVTILARRQWSDERIGAHLRTNGDNILAFRTRHGIASHYQPITAYAA